MRLKKLVPLAVILLSTIILVGCKNTTGYNDALVQSIRDSECQKYYDGCNTCEKMGLEEVCTEKYCSEFGAPKCLEEIKKELP